MTGSAPFRDGVTVRTSSPAGTRRLGARLARVARAGDRLALTGPLGVGKTEFAKGFAAGLGVSEVVNSPSFTLMAEYAGRLPLYHLDLYRLHDPVEAIEGGLLDEREAEGVTLIEWADLLPASLDPGRLEIRISVGPEDDARSFEIVAATPGQQRFIELARGRAASVAVRR